MTERAARALAHELESSRERKLEAIDEMKGWFEEWLLSLSPYQFSYMYRHFEEITNIDPGEGR